MNAHFRFRHPCNSFADALIIQTAINFICTHITICKKMFDPIGRLLLLRVKFRLIIFLLKFIGLWFAFQPLKATLGRNGKANVFCCRSKAVFDLVYDSYIGVFRISFYLQDAPRSCHNINTSKATVQSLGAFLFIKVSD